MLAKDVRKICLIRVNLRSNFRVLRRLRRPVLYLRRLALFQARIHRRRDATSVYALPT